jgi:hypothetical protein
VLGKMGKIVYGELSGDLCGFYDNDTGTIHVDRRMPRCDQRNTIIHERFHRVLGHGPAPSLPVHMAREIAVERLTARHLISLPRLMEVMTRFGTAAERAAALDVDEDILYARVFGLDEDEQTIFEVCVRRCVGIMRTPERVLLPVTVGV